MDVPLWAAALGAAASGALGLFGDLVRRVIPGYADLVAEVATLRQLLRERDTRIDQLTDEIEGLEDALQDAAGKEVQ